MKKTLSKNRAPLGFKTPENFSDKSKKSILSKIDKKRKKKPTYQLLSWFGAAAAAATLIFSLNQPSPFSTLEQKDELNDPFVTSLLIDTLLLDEMELDQQIQNALLDNFENDLALK